MVAGVRRAVVPARPATAGGLVAGVRRPLVPASVDNFDDVALHADVAGAAPSDGHAAATTRYGGVPLTV